MTVVKLMRTIFFLCYYLAILYHGFAYGDKNNHDEVELFLNPNFLQGRADVVFLLDRSGSVGATNFEIQKGFVESLLTHVAVEANATRIAVISYSGTPMLHINYISNPKTKCHLSQELLDVAYQDSGATNTAAALLEARKVLLDGRPNVNKVVIIISDGISTAGDNPVTAADLLKKDTGSQVFAFGIGKYLNSELTALASSVKHVYNCEGFQEFKRLARKIRGDPHENSWSSDSAAPNCDHLCDSPYKGEANDPGCCDHHAKCSCALLSGMHTCVCLPGYFGLDGTWGRCRICPRGTYKSNLEPSKACTSCPPGSTTAETGAKSIRECHCIDGYSGDPSNGMPCTAITCPPLQNPTNGLLLGGCENTFGSECLFMCQHEYELSDPKNDIRICQKDGKWSGTPPVCRKLQCNKPAVPIGGRMFCEQNQHTVGTICRFDCLKGYILQGSREQKCLPSKTWTGRETQCVAIQCPVPKPLLHGKVSNCNSRHNPVYEQICMFDCNNGYKRIGPRVMICNENGKLVDYYNSAAEMEPFCEDVFDPEITCPKNITVNTQPGQSYAIVNWELPIAYDNSGESPKIISNPSGFKPPLKFHIGTTFATYTAIDKSERRASCVFTITVRDKEKPRVLSCPSTVRVNTTDVSAQVFWEEPIFKDNSNEKLILHYQNYKSGDVFQIGNHIVYYDFRDPSGNYARCKFEVIVTRNICPYYPAPINGALVCDDWMYGQYCQAHCNYRYDFFSKPAEWYICNSDAVWETLPEGIPVPWPDCTMKANPRGIRKMLKGYYYYGDCNDPQVQDAIRSAFLYYFDINFRDKGYCNSQLACTLETVKVTCGATESQNLWRKKRDISQPEEAKSVDIELDILINSDEKLSDDIVQDFLNTLDDLQWEVGQELNEGFLNVQHAENSNTSDGQLGSLSVTSAETNLLCPSGSVQQNQECKLCTAGTYHNQILDKCMPCPKGEFQEMEGQVECVRCPQAMTTENENSKNATDCKGYCEAGTFSSTGLETCIACPVGSFQNESKQTECLLCANGTSTETEGAKSADDCRSACLPGSYSETGLEPCIFCPVGYYQDIKEQKQCKECSANFTTITTGSSSVSDCIDYDPCQNSSYCKNGATCFVKSHKLTCQCPEGFSGSKCDSDINECLSGPCFNGGSCINKDGGYFCLCNNGFEGNLCQREIKACDSDPCLNNGTCFENHDGYLCSCSDGFEGTNCELISDMCKDITCLNGGFCNNHTNDRISNCQCSDGFTGIDCSINIDDCYNVTCYNGGSCIDEITSFHCACVEGFTGTACETNVNECDHHNCFEGSTCIDLIGTYKCLCPPGWTGTRCENRMNSDFILLFPEHSSLANFASTTLQSPLSAATVSMWVQTNDDKKSGTPLSYATIIKDNKPENESQVLDNALTVSDCSGLSVYVNNEELITDISVNDGLWHQFAFTWSSKNNGIWKIYKDGELQNSGEGLQPNNEIISGGQLVLGQEQDEVLGGFSPLETFTGNITRLHIWNSVLSDADIFRLYSVDEDIPGKVIAWPDFLQGISGNIQIIHDERPFFIN